MKISDEKMKLTNNQLDEITKLVLDGLIKDLIKLETEELPDFELRRRAKFREKQKQDRERDNERHQDRVKKAQSDGITEDGECDDEDEYPLLAKPKNEDSPYHDENGRWSSKEDATCYSYQWKNGSISRMPGRKAVSRKGGVGRKTPKGGKGRILCKTGKPRE